MKSKKWETSTKIRKKVSLCNLLVKAINFFFNSKMITEYFPWMKEKIWKNKLFPLLSKTDRYGEGGGGGGRGPG